MKIETLWIVLGLLGQALFTLRFVVQWWRSERERRSVVPVAFWYLSLGGGLVLLLYAIHRRDPVFTLGQLFTQWGVRLDKSCVATYCTGDPHQPLGFVNGQLVGDPASISFQENDQIVVWFGPRGTNPPVPVTYSFPPSSTR